MQTYSLAPAGRRLILVLLVAALLIWAFALWSLASTLQISYNPLQLWPSLSRSLAAGLTVGQVVPALLMLVLIISTPLLIWSLLEEWFATYRADAEGLHFRSLGIALDLPWSAVRSLGPVDDDQEEPARQILLAADYSAQIGNPLLRFLHRQAHGSDRLLLYPGLADGQALAELIRSRSAAAAG